jgi:hypothetical protein
LSDGSTKRWKVANVPGTGNNTLVFHGQFFEQCELTNTAGRGALSLRLLESEDTLLETRVEVPDVTIDYQRSSVP